MSETKQAEKRAERAVRILLTSNDSHEGCILIREKGKPEVMLTYAEVADLAQVRQATAKEIAQKLRERIGDCAGAIISLRDIEEIEREYEVK